MPYIAVKAYPKDEAIKKEVAARINDVFKELWGCAPEAISISFEEVEPAKWREQVEETEIIPNADKMYVLNGKTKE